MLPSGRFILMVLGACPIFLAGAAYEGLAAVGILYLLLLAAYALADVCLLPRRNSIGIERRVPPRLSVGVPAEFSVTLRNLSRRTVQIAVAEVLPDGLDLHTAAPKVPLQHRQQTTLHYSLIARQRGRMDIGPIDVRILPAMGLFYRQFRLEVPAEVRVFPDLQNVKRYELLIRRGLLREAGPCAIRRVGQGGDFESLRSYVHGDEMSSVDWKTTARHGQLFVRNYQPLRQQSVLVALDVGRATAGEFEGLSRLDYLVNATLMLAYVCLRQGDLFSLAAFSDRIESYLPPVRRLESLDRVAQALYTLQPRLVESDYGAACRFLGLKNRKRSLICLMTDVIDRDASEVILAHMARFARRHLPLAVTLANPEINALAHQRLAGCNDPYGKAAALDVLIARNEALAQMRRTGVDVLDAEPRQLTPQLITRYLTIKRTRRL